MEAETTIKRSVKERKITGKLSFFEKELFGQENETCYTASVTHNKIDNL